MARAPKSLEQLEQQLSDTRQRIKRLQTAARRHDQVKAELNEQRLKVAGVLEEISDAYLAVDRQWRITYFNHAAELQGGAPREKMLGKKLWDVYPLASTEPGTSRSLERAMEQREPFEVETYYGPLKGWVHIRAYPTGEGLSIYVRTTTRRHQAEQALGQSEERFRMLAEQATDVVFRYRLLPERGYDYISPACARITGYAPAEFYADPDLHLKTVHADDRPKFDTEQTGRPQTIRERLTYRIMHKKGHTVWVESQRSLIYGIDGAVVGIHGTIRDVIE